MAIDSSEDEFINFVYDRMSTNDNFLKILEVKDFKGMLMSEMMNEIYEKMNEKKVYAIVPSQNTEWDLNRRCFDDGKSNDYF